jgi:IMP dehydrogenase
MLVKELMSKTVKSLHIGDDMEKAAMEMWEYDRGFMPVVDDQMHLKGVVTDRDICMCSAMNHRPLWELKTEDITRDRPLYSCKPDDDLKSALKTLKSAKLHRLPVVNDNGEAVGVLGLGDILNNTNKGSKTQISMTDAVDTMKGIYTPH